MRIGEFAKATGTTPRTVRYYEELGILQASDERSAGAHREYSEADVERLLEVVRLKHLLGLSLDELRDVMRGEDARVERRRQWRETSDPDEQRGILVEGLRHTDSLLERVRARKTELETFEAELNERRQAQAHALGELVK
jgi:MerR family transcriptional regulator, repressor of the yfmOP operon